MPWYYAGPDTKPIGPLSLDDLRAARDRGAVLPATYIIEHTGQAFEAPTWRRYQDVFPALAAPAPLPPAPPNLPPPLVTAPSLPHPLFPSAASAMSPHPTVLPPRHDPYYQVRPTNGWCAWGFVFGIFSFLTAFVCGIGIFPALLGVILCIVGLAQVLNRVDQSGRGLAISGLVLSVLAVIISVGILFFAISHFHAHELTVTEQTSNDSE